jgi:predicted short-subunit dehydrogenase-like oxidoreductase (DUF2520 family)
MSLFNISFLGAGKVAEALCLELYKKGHHIEKIVSPGKVNGPELAERCKAIWSPEPEFTDDTDIIIASVPDRLLKNILDSVRCGSRTILAHTAGSFGLEVFPDFARHNGLFYPLQTFSKGRKISFEEIPLFLEASDNDTESVLRKLAESIGCKVYKCDVKNRQLLHVAAVFVSNFTNYMFTAGNEISSRAGFSFDVLAPLIRETIMKAIENGPEKSQTGPAVRNDLNTIEKHMELLSFSPELRKIYKEVSESIIDYYKGLKENE